MNRLVKQIKDNAMSDRNSALQLFEECKGALGDIGNRIVFDIEGNPSADTFAKLISASTQALTQMGAANEKLLKLAQTMQRYQLKEMDMDKSSGTAAHELKGSLFSNLNSMLKDKDG